MCSSVRPLIASMTEHFLHQTRRLYLDFTHLLMLPKPEKDRVPLAETRAASYESEQIRVAPLTVEFSPSCASAVGSLNKTTHRLTALPSSSSLRMLLCSSHPLQLPHRLTHPGSVSWPYPCPAHLRPPDLKYLSVQPYLHMSKGSHPSSQTKRLFLPVFKET